MSELRIFSLRCDDGRDAALREIEDQDPRKVVRMANGLDMARPDSPVRIVTREFGSSKWKVITREEAQSYG